MPQVSQRPPPYSKNKTEFPPPLQSDVDHRAWAFQLAFENARELVRWTVLNTFKDWKQDWALKGRDVARANIQQAYSQAPEELKLAVDWQLKWDKPVIMQADYARRWQEHIRQKEAGIYEEVLSPEKFERQFELASPKVQRAALSTFAAWKWYHDCVVSDAPRRQDLVPAYKSASQPLKVVLCFVLEMAMTLPMQRHEDVAECEKDLQRTVEKQRVHAKRWNQRGEDAGLW
ncbi:hypothetical protein PENSPDRAFT_684118 [Peniophora sp. CONT]|nr:hypothetical protein PENSPDRAFT_684118 [Peniophora sp. CONT]